MGQSIGKAIGKYFAVVSKMEQVRKNNKEEKMKIKRIKEKMKIKRDFILKEKRDRSLIGERAIKSLILGKK